jgi:hypothetical protein
MPCITEYPDEERVRESNERAFYRASLCAILTAVENAGFDPFMEDSEIKVDWAEAGVTAKRLRKWWEDHKRHDEQRRAIEAAAAEHERKRRAALEKLTVEERILLFGEDK